MLTRILEMERKSPISFEEAIRLASQKWLAEYRALNGDGIEWLERNFVKWINSQGYHIEISGDEFEPFIMSDKFS